MARLIECIPNFSCSKEKDEATYNALVETAKSVPGCTLFDAQTDGNHNRCVFTLIGSPEAIEEVAFQLTKVATERIDMNKHHGEHKRMGATDVIPFVPQMDVTVEEAVEMSKRVAQRIWDELKVPSFLYEDSATRPERRNLATCRKGGRLRKIKLDRGIAIRNLPAVPGILKQRHALHCGSMRGKDNDLLGIGKRHKLFRARIRDLARRSRDIGFRRIVHFGLCRRNGRRSICLRGRDRRNLMRGRRSAGGLRRLLLLAYGIPQPPGQAQAEQNRNKLLLLVHLSLTSQLL